MFTIEQIESAQVKVKSAADFPNYVQDLIALGVSTSETHVTDNHTDYSGENGFKITSPAKYENLTIAKKK